MKDAKSLAADGRLLPAAGATTAHRPPTGATAAQRARRIALPLLCLALATPMARGQDAAPNDAQPRPEAKARPPSDADDEENMENVVVTGIRNSMASALDRKKNASVTTDSIVAEDIAEFPDKNVGEALQRVTGVQLDRDFGEGVGVSIRGVEPDLNRVEINGVSTLGTSASGERGADFRELAVELIKSIDVVKGYSADMTEGSIGGTVQVETRSPLELKEDLLALTTSLQYNDLVDDTGFRGNLTGGKKFLNDRLGAMVNVTLDDNDTLIHAIRNTEWTTLADYDQSPERTFVDPAYAGINSQEECPDAACLEQWWDFSPFVPRYGIWGRNDLRTSGMATLEYEISDELRVNVQGNINERDIKARDINLQVDLVNVDAIDSDSVTVDDEHNVVGLTTYEADINNRILEFDWKVRSSFIGTGFDWVRGALKLEGLAARSDAMTDVDSRAAQIQARDIGGIDVNLSDDGIPVIDFSNSPFDVNDPSTYNYRTRFSYRPLHIDKQEEQLKLDADYELDLPILSLFQSGLQWRKERDIAQYWNYDIVNTVGSSDYTQADLEAVFNANAEYTPGRFFGDYSLGTPVPERWLIVNATDFIADLDPEGISREDLPAATSGYDITEETAAFYLMFDFDTQLGRVPLKGNFGARYVRTDVGATGSLVQRRIVDNPDDPEGDPVVVTEDPIIVTFDKSYDDILPSVNLTAELQAQTLFLRFGYAEVMARPKLGDLAPRATCTYDETSDGLNDDDPDDCSAGNPGLNPYRANQYDLSLSWYPDRDTMLSSALFYKDVTSFITDPIVREDIDFFGDGTLFDVRQKVNGNGAKISGLELAAQTAFTFLPSPFDGFGGIVNYTYSTADDVGLTNQLTQKPLDFPGLSKHSYNVIGYYEKYGYQVRMAYNYRTEYLSRPTSRGGNPEYVEAAGYLDGRLAYTLPNMNLTFFFEAKNITKEVKRVNAGSHTRLSDLQWPGRRFFLGLNYRI